MSRQYDSSFVFQPASFPELTYVNRTISGSETYESRLKKALRTRGVLTLITGASKSGKTVLCHRVIPTEKMVEISGSHIQTPEDFWLQIGERLQLPSETEMTFTQNKEVNVTGEAGGKAGIPFIGDLNAKGALGYKQGSAEATKEKQQRSNILSIDYLIRNEHVLVLDDFHYVKPDVQKYIARVLKSEIFRGLKAILISLPHRADDAVRMNPDLTGRVRYINIEPWTETELRQIPKRGFDLLNVAIPDDVLDVLVQESITSPQLMQQNCLNLAFVQDLDEDLTVDTIRDIRYLHEAFTETTRDHENYETVIRKLIAGPPQGREKRKQLSLKTGEQVDIYELLLHALSEDPPRIGIDMSEIQRRISNILSPTERAPQPLNISNTLSTIQKILHASGDLFQILEWRDQELHILDPYFLFFLRWSDK